MYRGMDLERGECHLAYWTEVTSPFEDERCFIYASQEFTGQGVTRNGMICRPEKFINLKSCAEPMRSRTATHTVGLRPPPDVPAD